MKTLTPAIILVLAACGSPTAPKSAGFEERLLATIPEGAEVYVPPAFAPNGRSVAFVVKTPEGHWAIRDGWKSRRFDFF